MALEGHLELEAVAGPDGRTALGRQSFSAPFHVGKGYWDETVLRVQVVNPTAGMLEGDRMRVAVAVRTGAALSVGTPAASRSFRMRGGGRAVLAQRLEVARGAWLEYAPEPLYLHEGTDFEQRTEVRLEAGAELLYVDSLAPGRAARGELWRWGRLVNALDVSIAGIPQLRERAELGGEQARALAGFHGFAEAWLATVLVCSARPGLEAALQAAGERLAQAGCACGATRLSPELQVLRLAAPGGQQLRDALATLRAGLSPLFPALEGGGRRV
jgi:urease accessory protein